MAPENTLAAFRRAAEMGADGVELDVQCTADGVPVVIHDFTLERTTDGRGLVRQATWANLQTLDAGAWFAPAFAGQRIPSLEEVLEVLGETLLLNVELKARGPGDGRLEAAVAQAVEGSGLTERVLVSSFNPWCLWRFRRRVPRISLALLTAPDQPLPLRRGWLRRLCGADTLHPHHSMITPAFMEKTRRRGIWVNAWTVNDAETMHRLWRWGVGMVASDAPDRLVAALPRGQE